MFSGINSKAADKALLKDVMWNGYNAPYGQVEMLKSDFAGFSSVRIVKKKVASIQIHDYIETNNIIFTSIGGWRNGLPHQCGNVKGLGNIQPESITALQRGPCPWSREKGKT